MQPVVDFDWQGRDDGPWPEHARWFNTIQPWQHDDPAGAVLIGFASDEGVGRNLGRPGAMRGPVEIRKALGSFSILQPIAVYDAGDIRPGTKLEDGQEALGNVIANAQSRGHFTVALGGGHEITWASYLGLAPALAKESKRLGILNLDAHFDNRKADRATSGTGFYQIAEAAAETGAKVHTAALGICEHANTQALFDRADAAGLDYLLDETCGVHNLAAILAWVDDFLDRSDALYLTIDLDVMPAETAPGVSAPAARGVSQEVIEIVIDRAAKSQKLIHADIAELNPLLDIDRKTARVAARFAHHLVTKVLG